jgi:hypothetical protein
VWDPLARTPVYMIILPGAVKADLFPGLPPGLGLTHASGGSLRDADAHFWDWNLWLGAKRLRGAGPGVMFSGRGFYRRGLLFAAAWDGEFRFRTRQGGRWVHEAVDRGALDRADELMEFRICLVTAG